MRDIAETLSKGIKEGKWIDIEYNNQSGETTYFWIAIKDINPNRKSILCDIFNFQKSPDTFEQWIKFDGIKKAETLYFASYDVPEKLYIMLEKNSPDWLHYDRFNNNILNYYQEYSVKIKQSEDNFSLDSSYFKKSNDHLFKWGYLKKNGSVVNYINPGAKVQNVGSKLNSTSPVLVTVWDEGLVVKANIPSVTDGILTYKEVTKTYYRDNNGYSLSLSDFNFKLPEGYSFIGWRSDKLTFYTMDGSEKIYSYETEETNAMSFIIEESCTITPLIKEPINVSFYSYSGSSSSVTLDDLVIDDRYGKYISFTEDQTLKDGLDSKNSRYYKYLVTSIETKDNFLYWAYLKDGQLVKIDDIGNFYVSKDSLYEGTVRIVAVFKGE